MAISTRRPGGNWTRVSPAYDYAGIASAYSQILQQASQAEKEAELQSKMLAYQEGTLSYEDFKKYLQQRKGEYPEGSLKAVEFATALFNLEETERSNKKAQQRAELESQFAQGGVTAAERLLIEKSLLQLEKEGTTEYKQQQSRVSQAEENANVEAREQRIANLTAQLTEGGLTTDESIEIYERLQADLPEGSTEWAQAQQKIQELKIQAKEEELEANLTSTQNELMQQFMPDGISTEEQLQIITALKQIAPRNSEAYTKILEQEASVRATLKKEQEGAAGSADREAQAAIEAKLVQHISGLKAQLNRIETDQNIPEIQKEQARAQFWTAISESLSTSGVDSIGGTTPAEALANAQAYAQRVQQRESGEILDVYDYKGNVRTVSLQELENDIEGKYNVGAVIKDATGKYIVQDPLNLGRDEQLKGQQFNTFEEAARAASQIGIKAYDVLVTGQDGLQVARSVVQNPDGGFFMEGINYDPATKSITKDSQPFANIPTNVASVIKQQQNKPFTVDQAGLKEQVKPKTALQATFSADSAPNKFAKDVLIAPIKPITYGASKLIETIDKTLKDSASRIKSDGGFNLSNVIGTVSGLSPTVLGAKTIGSALGDYTSKVSQKYNEGKDFGSGLAPLGTKKSSTFLPDFGFTEAVSGTAKSLVNFGKTIGSSVLNFFK